MSSTQKQLMAASVLSNDLLARFALERQVSYPTTDFDRVFHVVCTRFDESTMPISMRHTAGSGFCSVPPLADARSSSTLCEPGAFLSPTRRTVAHVELCNRPSRLGWCSRTGDTLTPVQTVDRSSTEVILQLARSRSGASLASKGFRTTAWLVTGDHHGAQLKAERVMQAELGGVFPFSEGVRRTRLHKFTQRRSPWLTHTFMAPCIWL